MRTLEEDLLHPGEDELVQLMDGELPEGARTSLQEHIAACGECRARLDELEGISGWLRNNVEQLDAGIAIDEMARARALAAVRIAARREPKKQSLTHQGWFRAAAAVVLLIGAALSVTPLRAWLLDLRSDEVAEAPLPVVRVIAPAAVDAGATLSFRPVTASFAIELASAQAGGTITIGTSPTDQASAQIIGGGEESVMILPSGLRIENSATSTASYRILLPSSLVRQFEVTAGASVLAREELDSGTAATTLNLAGAAAAQ